MAADAPELKSPPEIEGIAAAGRLLWTILDEIRPLIHPGVRTQRIATEIESRILLTGAEPLLPRNGFPAAASICLNDEVVNVPPGPALIRQGDLVTVDAALRLRGWCADAAISQVAGDPTGPGGTAAARLVQIASDVLQATLAAIKPGTPWSQAATAAWEAAASAGCTLIAEYAGHGIGREMHETTALPFLRPATQTTADPILLPGMALAIEPIVTFGRGEVYGDPATWTVRTADRALACYHEVTIAVIQGGVRVLTGPG